MKAQCEFHRQDKQGQQCAVFLAEDRQYGRQHNAEAERGVTKTWMDRQPEPPLQVTPDTENGKQCCKLSHALHNIQRGGNQEGIKQPQGGGDQRDPVCFAGRRTTYRRQQLANRGKEDDANQQVNQQIGALKRRWIGGPVVGVDQETGQCNRTSGGAGKTAGEVCLE